MIDLNKEREAFEAWLIKKFDLPPKSFSLDFNDGIYDSIPTQARWEAWKEKAKAQAVPDTHIVVPKLPSQEMIQAGLEKVRESWDENPPDGFNSFMWGDMIEVWKDMVEASKSGAEG
ncbi:hypothetical protein [Acinetobacter nosocomialis]|uniref:hypothetical protein n=1 Tax=Acinetobacter nosocomialis TaxID=106654 RepID=UPI001A9BF8AD|nr:hypothetical protein [Acinetobacter nosocomialis]MBO1279737.1 hypothetical protein [Acinetobacter nosocomialis]